MIWKLVNSACVTPVLVIKDFASILIWISYRTDTAGHYQPFQAFAMCQSFDEIGSSYTKNQTSSIILWDPICAHCKLIL